MASIFFGKFSSFSLNNGCPNLYPSNLYSGNSAKRVRGGAQNQLWFLRFFNKDNSCIVLRLALYIIFLKTWCDKNLSNLSST